MSIKARSRAKAKVDRLTRSNNGPVDASGWREPLGENANIQTGERPISRRQFRAGGKVAGIAAAVRADRKPRKLGGPLTVDGYLNRDVRIANEKREGPKHDGGFKRGGRTHRDMGGLALPNWADKVSRKSGGKVHSDAAEDKKLIRAEMAKHEKGCKCAKCYGGRAEKAAGGSLAEKAMKMRQADSKLRMMNPMTRDRTEFGANKGLANTAGVSSMSPEKAEIIRKLGGGKKSGGSVADGTLEGTRPKGGRMARAKGGRAKTNINIIIAPPKAAGMPMPGGPPPGGPVGMRQGVPPPPPAPPAGAPPAMGPPPGIMPRKRGGRTGYPIKDGAGGGKGRLEKIRAYG